jgi:hypothetical protein
LLRRITPLLAPPRNGFALAAMLAGPSVPAAPPLFSMTSPLTDYRQFVMLQDPASDFTYIIGVTGYTFGVVVRSDAPWKTFHNLASCNLQIFSIVMCGVVAASQWVTALVRRLNELGWIEGAAQSPSNIAVRGGANFSPRSLPSLSG